MIEIDSSVELTKEQKNEVLAFFVGLAVWTMFFVIRNYLLYGG